MAKIMIVDDDLQAASLLEKVVRMNGHEAIVVTNSLEAMSMAKARYPDLFLLDLMMPELNGYELCALLRADPDLTARPVIVVSALEDKASRVKAFDAGVNEYVTKPYDIIELAEQINSLLSNGKG